MTERVDRHGLKVAKELDDFIVTEALPGTGVDGRGVLVRFQRHRPRSNPQRTGRCLPNATRLQAQDRCLAPRAAGPSGTIPCSLQGRSSQEVGYLVPEGWRVRDFDTANVDDEIATHGRPSTRRAGDERPLSRLNAANARWGSLYDAFYGTDIIPESPGPRERRKLQPRRAASWSSQRAMPGRLDAIVPLEGASHADATGLRGRSRRRGACTFARRHHGPRWLRP